MVKMIFFVTHGETLKIKHRRQGKKHHRKPFDPPMNIKGIKQIILVKKFMEDELGLHDFPYVVMGVGRRFKQMLKIWGREVHEVESNDLAGTHAVMERTLSGIMVNAGTYRIPRDKYGLERKKPSLIHLFQSLPHKSLILGSRAALYALGIDNAESATLYRFKVENGGLSHKILFSALGREEKSQIKVA